MVLVDHNDGEREFDYRISPMGRLESHSPRLINAAGRSSV